MSKINFLPASDMKIIAWQAKSIAKSGPGQKFLKFDTESGSGNGLFNQ